MARKYAEAGVQFGDWTTTGKSELRPSGKAFRYHDEVVCICGESRFVQRNSLTSGASTSCGRCSRVKQSEAGIRYGYQTTTGRTEWRQFKSKRFPHDEVLCICGESRFVSRSNLVNGTSTNCGCRNRKREDCCVGNRYGRLTVQRINKVYTPTPTRPNKHSKFAECLCDCGNTSSVNITSLKRNMTRSCGCLQRDITSETFTTHGRANHHLYSTHKCMMQRCLNPKHKDYPYYGGRGIQVCKEWHDVETFINWIETNLGPRPESYTLDRIQVDGNYEAGNVRWADAKTQRSNQRKHKRIEEAA